MTPLSPQETLSQGMELHRAGRLAEGMACYRSLLCGPLALEARINLGAALDECGDTAEALEEYRQALALSPHHPLAHFNLGNALMKLGRHGEAAQSFCRALPGLPGVEARLALGAALQAEGDLDGALRSFREALRQEPGHPEAHWYLALALLSAGELSEGWREYEWRWRKASFTSLQRVFPQPLWDGSPLAGRRILLHGEQGFGDTIHFVRYAPLVAAAGGTVLVECQHASLQPIVQRVPGVSAVAVLGEALPPFEVQIPLLSLPRVLGTTLDTIPACVPYLSADPQRLHAWRQRVAHDGTFKVGVVWAGKRVPDPFRSCTLADLAPLAQVAEVTFYSLQLEKGAGEPAPLPLTDLTGAIADFGDTAALIAQLDLVISVDTSVAHLAGALGKPVFLMLPKACDWRWMRDRDDSPWYPATRLFRQKEQGRWGDVVQQVLAALKERVWSFLECASAREPRSARRAYACGSFLAEEGRVREACARFMKAALLEPALWQAHYGVGVSQQRLGLFSQARDTFAEGVAAAPHAPLLHEGLGVLLQMQGDLPGACASYRRALQLDPGAVRSLYNLGTACRELGLFAEALHSFERVAVLAPDHADARWNLAVLLLMHGDFPRGWQEFPWRFRKSSAPVPQRLTDRPRWDGSPLGGRTILLHAEQGLGDTVHFCRYAPLVAQRGGRVLLEVQSATLRPLLERLPGVATVLVPGDPAPEFEVHASLMDLPGIFGTTPATVPPAPYLAADQALKELWRRRLPGEGTFRVGLVWSGSPGHENDANRSLPLQALAPLGGVPGVSFHSLQLGAGAAQLAEAPFPIYDATGAIRDLADTAALAANLDLVLTVDTCVAHLCGALGVPVWVLIPLVPDWRWMLERDDSLWYPSMRLFRQKERGGWQEVIERVSRALAASLDRERGAQHHKMRGMALTQEGRHREAAQAFEAALAVDPRDAESLNNLGSALDSQGRHEEAVGVYLQAIACDGALVAPHYNMGNALKTLGRVPEAIASYRRALEIEPKLVQGWHNLALTLRAAGEAVQARQALARALEIEPGYLEALHSLGELLHDSGDLAGAEEAFRRALQRDPGYLPSLNALGMALQIAARPQEAIPCYLRALAIQPDYLHALNNLGAAYRSLGRLHDAVACYRKVVALDPDYADAYWNLSLVLLHLGEYREGWRLYEWRFAKVEPIPRKVAPHPLWDGSPPAGRTILLHAEQGFGDTMQFVRYATLVASLGATVHLECQVAALKPLLATVAGVTTVVARGEALPSFDLHAPLMSLPHLCGTTLETIPARIPYLSADPEREALWRERVRGGGVRVGIVWAGRRTYKDDRKRSLSLSLFAPLARVRGASFYTLQMGDGAEQGAAPPAGLQLNDLTGGINDFADTAAFIANLDVVISADTAVAHLTGALGKPVWVLIPFACDWRWLTSREDSPWYPTARLFRQREPGDWGGVLERVADALEQMARELKRPAPHEGGDDATTGR